VVATLGQPSHLKNNLEVDSTREKHKKTITFVACSAG